MDKAPKRQPRVLPQTEATKAKRFWQDVWLYVKYQLFTKPIFFLVVWPLSKWLTGMLIGSTGRSAISSGDWKSVLLSWQGGLLVLLGIAMIVLLIATDISAFIIMEATRITRGKRPTAFQTLIAALKSIRLYFHPATLILAAYVGLIVPLSGVGLSVGPLKGFKIPNFITDVIFKNTLYLTAYTSALLVFAFIGFFLIFSFHFIVLEVVNPWVGIKKSVLFVKQNWASFIKRMPIGALFLGSALALSFILTMALLLVPRAFVGGLEHSRFWTILTMLIGATLIAFIMFLVVPIVVRNLTDFYFEFNDDAVVEDVVIDEALTPPPTLPIEVKDPGKRPFLALSGLIVIAVFFNVGLAWVSSEFFDQLFKQREGIQIVAHRAGGDLGPENTVEGMDAAIKEGAAWAEIDIQRTKDGGYVVNHDGNFARTTGDDRTSLDLTTAEATRLDVKDLFDPSRPSAKVNTIEEFMEASKGKIGLFIELKGSTADEQMVDDMAKLIKERGMEKEAALLSLDYKLIDYAETNYPELITGFLYFFSVGEPSTLKGDFLIMEEREATPENIERIQAAGKKAVVWTVNTDESIQQFITTDIDGIITDYPVKVREAIEARKHLSDQDLIIEAVFS